jgi:hypothetical protein
VPEQSSNTSVEPLNVTDNTVVASVDSLDLPGVSKGRGKPVQFTSKNLFGKGSVIVFNSITEAWSSKEGQALKISKTSFSSKLQSNSLPDWKFVEDTV